ncbi:MAG TPA: hypothetical protein VFE07_02440 [Marmoricola sp.]|jgi:hypothetical protein|nr:hypothetical protein [Marmoricola sp.]
MTPRATAVLLGSFGGVLLAAAGGLSFLARESRDWHGTLAVAGYVAAIAALVAVGYALVAHAPVWLRLIVSVAFPLLMASVWQVVDQAIDDRVDGWKAAATSHLAAGVVVLVAVLVGIRVTRDPEDAYAPTHHR